MKKIKLLCPNPDVFSQEGLAHARKYFYLDAIKLNQDEFDRLAVEYDAVLVRFDTQIRKDVMIGNSKLKYILSPTTGLDHIDINEAKKNEIKLFHLRDKKKFLSELSGTAELTIALMFSLSRKIPDSVNSVRKGEWKTESFRGKELRQKNLGIIGYGRLGKMVGKICRSIGMNINVYDPYVKNVSIYFKHFKDLNLLISNSDIITIHVPLNNETYKMIGRKEFNSFRKSSYLINTSRGDIIDQKALLNCLKNKKIAGAALDVISQEFNFQNKNKNKSESELTRFLNKNDNLIITPHIGGATHESVIKTDIFIIDQMVKSV